MPAYDPRAVTDKQLRRAQAATQDYIDGVNNTTKDPAQRAIAKKEKMRTAWNHAIDSGKWAENLGAVTLTDWKRLTSTKGGERYAAGVAAAAQKVMEFHEQFASFLDSHLRTIHSMPDTTVEQRLARMTANAKGIAAFRFRRRR